MHVEEGNPTFAVGHLALGYITGKATSKLLNLDINIPLLLVASVIPDIDLLIPGLQHRGPTHSVIILTLLLTPAFIRYGKKATPYYIALIQHPIIGDSLTGGQGTQLLWPITTNWYPPGISMETLTGIYLEWIFFIGCTAIMLRTKDVHILFQGHRSNLILTLPIATVLLPTLFSIPLHVPAELIIPHLIYLTIFTISILTDLKTSLKRHNETSPANSMKS